MSQASGASTFGINFIVYDNGSPIANQPNPHRLTIPNATTYLKEGELKERARTEIAANVNASAVIYGSLLAVYNLSGIGETREPIDDSNMWRVMNMMRSMPANNTGTYWIQVKASLL